MSKSATAVTAIFSLWSVAHVTAQEAVREMLNNPPPSGASQPSEDYTFKVKDLQMLITPSFGVDYNDNISISDKSQLQDVILKPLLSVNGLYPITERNLFTFNAGVGYDQYVDHDRYSGLRLTSGSGVGFDMGIGDFEINLHDRFSYSQDAANQTAIAGNGQYGMANNTIGMLTSWDLGDVISTVGYDHQNVMSTSDTAQAYQSQDHSSELLVGRVGLKVHPELVTGIEATGSFTTYDKRVLNDNTGYSLGAYAEYKSGDLSIQPRGGYAFYNFDHTSVVIQTASLDSWYADLTGSYQITKAISGSLSAGHQTQLGIQSDAIETYYLRPGIRWAIIEGGSLNLGGSYENGKQGVGNRMGNLNETYDYYGANLGFSYQITKRLTGALNYRLTLRSSNASDRGYTQNLVGITLSYPLD